MGFSKMEGTTVNIKDKVAYPALQNIQDSMVKTGKGWNAASGIALDKALVVGGVMALPMTGGHTDQTGTAIKSEWVPSVIPALLMGQDIAPDALGNLANPDRISNPDNLKFSEKLRTLFIGEDSGTHVNKFVWAYDVDTKQLSRLMSMPSGAEATGLGVVDDLNGWTYITSNFQHPGDWNAKLHGKVQAASRAGPVGSRQFQEPLWRLRRLPHGRWRCHQAGLMHGGSPVGRVGLAGLFSNITATIPDAFPSENLPAGALIHEAGQGFQFIVGVVDGLGWKNKTAVDGGWFDPKGLVVV